MFSNLWHRFRNIALALKSQAPPQSSGQPDKRRGTVLHAECLEQRRMLSANQIHFDSGASSIVIEGTSSADSATVSTDASNMIRVTMTNTTGTQVATFSPIGVNQISFIGGDGDDRFEKLTAISSAASGEGGNDVLIAGPGGGNFSGGAGNDTLIGNVGVDHFSGDEGNDMLVGNGGD